MGLFAGPNGGGTVLRDSNRRRLLALLQDHGALTRADLVRRSGISRATVSGVVAALLDDGFIREVAPPSGARDGRVGRPSALLTLDPLAAGEWARSKGLPEDVARAAVFLASDDASWISGVTLDIAGGAVLV